MDKKVTFKEELIKKLKEKNLADSTIHNYLRNLEMLNDGKPFKSLLFLKDTAEIKKKIDLKKPNTQRTYYISIVSVLKCFPNLKKLFTYYYEVMMKMNTDLKKVDSNNEKTETQKKNWVETDEIEEHLTKLEDEVKSFPATINQTQYKKVLQMIVLSLYTLAPPRRNEDYIKMQIVKEYADAIEPKTNYLVYDDKTFIFKKYKNSKSELRGNIDEKVIDIDKDLWDNIKLYLKFHPRFKKPLNGTDIYFLVNFDDTHLKASNSITYILNSIFDKNVGSSMLRHIYLSSKYGNVLEEMKTDNEKMSHSLGQQKDYIKK